MDTVQNNQNAWNKHAGLYQQMSKFSFDQVDYGSIFCPTEADLNLIGDVKGLSVLELGCGGANCGIALAKRCASVTCVDFSEEQLKYARINARREEADIKFVHSPMEKLDLSENQFDVVISMAALQYVENQQKVFNMVYKTLRNKGIFVFSLPDAIYSTVTAKYLWNAPEKQHSYFYTGPERWKWDENDDFEFITFRRPLCEYINMLIDTGFTIKRVYQFQNQQIQRDGASAFNALYPGFIVFKVCKRCLI